MSSPESEDAQPLSSPRFQSAQQPADQHYAEREDPDLESGSDYLPDAPSDGTTSPLPSLEEDHLVDDSVTNKFSAEGDLDDEYPDATTLPSRSNKFRGPPSTWRNRTAPERDLAASLDQVQAKDLSVHLYNSFKLGQRNRIRGQGWRTRTSDSRGERKQRSKWVPPKVWTAWPLPPDIVPREDDETRWQEDAVPSVSRHSSPKRPSRHLQEMLIAQVLRSAKERFHERQWEGTPQSGMTATAQGQQSQGIESVSNKKSKAKHDHESLGQKPVVMADDHRAGEILQATVQHMMTKLNDLLMGLHHARSAYLLVPDSGSETDAQTSERSVSRGRLPKRKRKPTKPDEDTGATTDAPDHPSRKKSGSQHKIEHVRPSSGRSRSRIFRNRKNSLGLRGWSDVLGIASMTGWHQSVVGSATARCATLFDECIKFRTLEEGKKVQEEHLYLPDALPLVSGENSQGGNWQAREDRSNIFDGAMVGGVHVDGFLKPIAGKKSWVYGKNKQSKRRQLSRESKG